MTVCCVILMSEAKKNLNDILALYSTTFRSSAFPNAEAMNRAFVMLKIFVEDFWIIKTSH
jgi:hypothetical protein